MPISEVAREDGAAGDGTPVGAEVGRFLDEQWDPDLTVGEWWDRLARSGWAFPTWPRRWHGRGLPPEVLVEVSAVFRARGVLGAPGGLGQLMGGPVLMRHGDEDQCRRHLWPLASGAEAWCQFFSEPGSGSDLASAQTRAVRDGDEWVVNGQKVWTSGAKTADRGMLLARVDAEVPKHRGLGYFIIEVDQPGVEVRPLKQMTGESHFNEVFFTDARVSHTDLVGRPGDGWAAAVTTLAFERSGRAGTVGAALRPSAQSRRRRELREWRVADAIDPEAAERTMTVDTRNPGLTGRQSPLRLLGEPGAVRTDPVRQQVARYYVTFRVNALTQERARATTASGRDAGPTSSVTKLARSVVTRINRDLGPAILGASGMLAGPEAPVGGHVAHGTLQAPSTSIAGGTDEIQHNIIGERVLGLPREPQVDRDVPFRELQVGTVRRARGEGEAR
ncbi:MAG: acyl-CoA dehydrogenase family protein [Actinomycetota bacterium]|jgi:alkylation response protein AidB-like acyl-CoA dehydrogenase|nr:acyl-CoA dehydrogenase family protein [Actinomycetota bacterium]